MFLEQEIINKVSKRVVEMSVFNGEIPKHLDFDEIHDECLHIKINGEYAEDNDILYNIIVSIINDENIIRKINERIEYLYENGIVF